MRALILRASKASNMIILVNDNDMSIAENHGGIYKNLRMLRESGGKCECNLFRSMGLDYKFEANGNDIQSLIKLFESVKDIDHPVVLHIVTEKGKGYAPAVKNKENWHYCAPFNIETGKPTVDFGGENYSDITAEFLLDKMAKDKKVVAITSAVPTSMGFDKARRDKAGSQFVDVGIAEEHAVALASGIAKNGGKPVYGTYSTFIQRTYDQIAQDLCLNSEPATIVLYGASVFGMNDACHIGYYDIPMLSNILNLVYLAPTCKEEYLAMLDWSIEQNEYPVAIRVPENGVVTTGREFDKDYGDLNKYQITQSGAMLQLLRSARFIGSARKRQRKSKAKRVKSPL